MTLIVEGAGKVFAEKETSYEYLKQCLYIPSYIVVQLRVNNIPIVLDKLRELYDMKNERGDFIS